MAALSKGIDVADPLAARLSRLPEVSQALTLSSFVPEDQDKKLALIADANNLLDPTLNPFDVKPTPSDADIVTSFEAVAAKPYRQFLRAVCREGEANHESQDQQSEVHNVFSLFINRLFSDEQSDAGAPKRRRLPRAAGSPAGLASLRR